MVEEPLSRLPEGLPPEGGREQICAYFEMLRAHRVVLTVETEDGVEMEGQIQSLDMAKGRLVLSLPKAPSVGMDPDDVIDLYFTVAGNRWVGRARVHYHSDHRDRYSILLPERLEPSDRRRELRAMLDPLENIRGELTSAEDLRLQLRGRLSNISESGFRFSLEDAVDTGSGREVDPEALSLRQGYILDQVRIEGLRQEVLETQGRIMDVSPGLFGAILGVRFRSLKPKDRLFLKDYVQHHAFTPPEVLPPLKHIPFAEEILQEINAAAEAAGSLPGESTVAVEDRSDTLLLANKQMRPLMAPPLRKQEPQEAAPVEGPADKPAEPPAPDVAARMRLKRFRSVVLVMTAGPDRQSLQNFLAAQGFTRVMLAGTVGELAHTIKAGGLDLVLVDWQDPGVGGLDIADFLLHYPFRNFPKVILACPHVTSALANEAHSKGVMHLLVKPYQLDGALVDLLLSFLSEE